MTSQVAQWQGTHLPTQEILVWSLAWEYPLDMLSWSSLLFITLLWSFGYCSRKRKTVFLGGSDDKESSCNAEDPGLIHGLGRSSGEANGKPLQYSCLENSLDRGARWAMGLQSWIWLTNTFTFKFLWGIGYCSRKTMLGKTWLLLVHRLNIIIILNYLFGSDRS